MKCRGRHADIPESVSAWLMSTARAWAARKNPSTRWKGRNNAPARVEGNYWGLACQWALADALAVPHNIDTRVGGDDGFDVTRPDGRRIEVKWARKSTPPIYLPLHPSEMQKPWQVAVLGATCGKSIDLIGWVPRVSFEALAFVFDFGYGPRRCYDSLDLLDIEGLLHPDPCGCPPGNMPLWPCGCPQYAGSTACIAEVPL